MTYSWEQSAWRFKQSLEKFWDFIEFVIWSIWLDYFKAVNHTRHFYCWKVPKLKIVARSVKTSWLNYILKENFSDARVLIRSHVLICRIRTKANLKKIKISNFIQIWIRNRGSFISFPMKKYPDPEEKPKKIESLGPSFLLLCIRS